MGTLLAAGGTASQRGIDSGSAPYRVVEQFDDDQAAVDRSLASLAEQAADPEIGLMPAQDSGPVRIVGQRPTRCTVLSVLQADATGAVTAVTG